MVVAGERKVASGEREDRNARVLVRINTRPPFSSELTAMQIERPSHHYATFFALLLLLATGPLGGAVTHHQFLSNGVPISYTDEGHGTPVVLIHGLTSSGDRNWRMPGVIHRLTPHYRVITIDVRGHGRSGKPESEAAYGVQLEEDVVRLLDHLHIPRAHVVGYSMGGMIAMKLMVLHPGRVQSALLGGMGWLRERSPLQDYWRNLPPPRGGGRGHASAVARSLGELAVLEEHVRSIKVPVEVVAGDRDPVRRLYVEPLRTIRPDWPLVLIPDAGHITCVAKPQFRDAVAAWLERVAAPR
jgi:pimeloyl-ACP methyl ester carboxylesterase